MKVDQSENSGLHSEGKLPALVFGKMEIIMNEFCRVLDASSRRWTYFKGLLAKATEKPINSWVQLLVACTLENASELNRRIVSVVDAYPAQLAWLFFSRPDVACQKRQEICGQLLVRRSERLLDEAFTCKFCFLFEDELRAGATSGFLSENLHQLLTELFALLPLETQEVEGTNSIIKKIYELAPNIHLPLMSDRVLIKKALASKVTQGQTAADRRESRMDAIAYAVESHPLAIQQNLDDLCFKHVLAIFKLCSTWNQLN